MRTHTVLVTLALVMVAILGAGCTNTANLPQNTSVVTPTATPAPASGSPEELVAFVEKAYEYAQVYGQEAALREFNNRTGRFVEGELYMFANDLKGNTLALPFQPDLIGKNRWNATDPNGTAFIQALIRTAQSDGGFVHYQYLDPSDNFSVKQKLSYVMLVDQDWLIGSGIYEPEEDDPIVSAGADPRVREILKSLVAEAIAYAGEHGKDAAIAEFNDRNGTFVRGNLYIYAFDYNGTTLSLPHQPRLIGTDLSGLQDPFGVNYTRIEILLAQQGGGFIYYHYPNPARNMTVEPKMSYVAPVDETWWLGAGVYLEDMIQTVQPDGGIPANGTIRNLTFYTEQLPPYNYMENGTLQGISIDLFELITEKMGKKVSRDQVRLVPWSGGYQAALTGNNTMIFAIARIPARETSFQWAGPIYPYTTVVFARPDRGIVIDNPADLQGYRIGVIAEDAAVQQLLDIGVNQSQLVQETNASALVARLQSGEIDLWAYSKASGRYFTWQVTGNAYAFRIVYTFPDIPIYYGFSRDVPDATVQDFQQALDALKAEKDAAGISTYERVLGRHVPAVGLAQLQYLTEEWAPYNFEEDGNASGISVDILEAIFKDIGVNRSREDVRIVPLAEGFQAAQNGSTVLFSIVRSPEREPLYKWAGPFTKGSFVVYAPLSRNITITSPGDLNQYRIGAVRGTIENTLLADRGVNASQIVNGPAPEDLLRMLEEGQIDLWATGDLAGRHQMLQTAADPNEYEIVYTLSENDFYYIFSKDVPDTMVSAFEQALQNVRLQRDAQGVSDYERIMYRYLGVGCARQTFTDAQVMALVNATAADIERNALDTFRRINAGEAPYRDAEDSSLYVFVYDTNVTMMAHADNIRMVGVNYRGKTDVTGKPFRDEIVAGALANGTGWVEYVYSNPAQTGLYYKTSYYRRTEGSDGKTYYVCSGNFKSC